MTPEHLEDLRLRIREIDDQILELTSERMEICRQVGEYKRDQKLPIKDFKVEKLIIERIRDKAKNLNISPELAESLMKQLIKYSVFEQEDIKANHLSQRGELSEKNVLIVGGSGNMGRWMAQFFESLSHTVRIFDVNLSSSDLFPIENNLDQGLKWADIIVLATPMVETNLILNQIAKKPVKGIVVEITSLKSPVRTGIEACVQAKQDIVSIHPMFGPDVKLLAGRNIIVCDGKHFPKKAMECIKEIFSLTSANLVTLPFDKHDSYMSYVLGSAHLLNLVYGRILSQSGFSLKNLQNLAGTTFSNQLEVTQAVVLENQDLYFDIQALNDATDDLLDDFHKVLDNFKTQITARDRAGFKEAMTEALDYFNQDLKN